MYNRETYKVQVAEKYWKVGLWLDYGWIMGEIPKCLVLTGQLFYLL